MRFACLKRREFITFIGLATALPLAVHAQQAAKIPRIGILSPGRPSASSGTRKDRTSQSSRNSRREMLIG
jgi:putative ABC transport system substrate-binding protein